MLLLVPKLSMDYEKQEKLKEAQNLGVRTSQYVGGMWKQQLKVDFWKKKKLHFVEGPLK